MRRRLLATTLGLLTIAASAGAATLPAQDQGLRGQLTHTARAHDSTSTKPKKKTKTPPAKDPTTTSSTSPATPAKPPKK